MTDDEYVEQLEEIRELASEQGDEGRYRDASRLLRRFADGLEALATLRRNMEARERAEEEASSARLRRSLDSWGAA